MRAFSKPNRAIKTLMIILGSIVLTVVLIASAGLLYLNYLLNHVNHLDPLNEPIIPPNLAASLPLQTDPVDPGFSGPSYDPEDVTLPPLVTLPPKVEENQKNVVNILLVGQDRDPGEARRHSDTMILCTFHKEEKTITLTSFMRDLYVIIPGYQDHRLNNAYLWGGFGLLKDALYTNFGVEVDACIEVDFNGFIHIIDLLDGVDITLTEAEAQYLRDGCKYDVSAGINHLTGEQALNYARLREIDSDFNRTQRQRNVLSAVFNRYFTLEITQMHDLLLQILPYITTDMTNSDMIGYLFELFPVVSAGQLNTLRIPASGMYENARIRGMMVLLPDLEANREVIFDMLDGK